MLTVFKKWFTDNCPVCQSRLQAESNIAYTIKSCSQGHYKEEVYCTLGVRVTYKALK